MGDLEPWIDLPHLTGEANLLFREAWELLTWVAENFESAGAGELQAMFDLMVSNERKVANMRVAGRMFC